MTADNNDTTRRHRWFRRRRTAVTWPRYAVVMAGATGLVMTAGVADAATNWTVGLNPGSSANAEGAGIQNLTISAAATGPTLTNQLYPGGNGDVQFSLQNPNPFPVNVTAITIPAETLSNNDAVGYPTSNTGGTAISGCGATSSTVTWKGFSGAPTSKTLSTGTGAFTIAANSTITVLLLGDASMDTSAPLACAGTSSGSGQNLTYAGAYFVMPALTTVTATGGGTGGVSSGAVTTGY